MKKYIIVCLMLLTACGSNNQSSDLSSTVTETLQSVTTNITHTTQTDITQIDTTQTETTLQTTKITETSISQTTSTESVPETSQNFETDENGAVIFETDETVDDSELISAAQVLYENACETEFRYHVGCPYNLDYSDYVENSYGWKYYLVVDSGYNSLEDVENDYYKIFSWEYGSDLNELYIENDGKLYAFDGARGKNVFYQSSQVTEIVEKTDDKIIFNVENYYSGNDIAPDTPITETEQFSVIINDGEWRVGDFYLPY